MRALRSRRRALTAPQSSWHSEAGNDNAYDTPGDGLRIHVTTLVALNEGTWVSTSAIKSSDLLFGCRQQSRRGGYPAKILSSYRFNRRLPMANVVASVAFFSVLSESVLSLSHTFRGRRR